MPIYEYRCSSCGHELEALQKLSDAPLVACPSCSKGALVKLVSAAGFKLKGSGWYATDFKGSGSKPAEKKAVGESKSESKSVGESKSESKSVGESKSESKPDSAPKPESKSSDKTDTPAPARGAGASPASS